MVKGAQLHFISASCKKGEMEMSGYRESVRWTLMKFALAPVLLLVLLGMGLVAASWEVYVVRQSDVGRAAAREALEGIFSDCAVRVREAAERVEEHSLPALGRSAAERAELYACLYRAVNIAHDGARFYLLGRDGTLILGSQSELPPMRIPLQISWGVLRRMKEKPNAICTEFAVRGDGRQDLIIGQTVGEEAEGYLLFVIPNEYLEHSVASPYLGFALTDAFSNICMMTGGEWSDRGMGKLLPDVSAGAGGIVSVRGQKYFVTSEPLGAAGSWTLWSVMPVSDLLGRYLLGLAILAGVLLVLVPVLLVSVRRESRARIRMMEEEEARATAISEMRRLESQFNPHFLFNTLENIKFMVKLDPTAAQHMLAALASLLRYSIKGEARSVPFSEDLAYTHSYMEIQQYRFGKRLAYEEQIAPDTLTCMVPRLLLQPLLENAVRYGASEDGAIRIALRAHLMEQDRLEIIIRDHGEGMDADTLEEVKSLLARGSAASGATMHTGIYNIHRRLQLMYGRGFGLLVSCPSDGGTLVTLRLPVERRKESC